jgi:hypothetical protein
MGFIQYKSAGMESQTYDESNQLMTGFGFWKLGRYNTGIEHPPLAKLFLTAPLITLGLDLPPAFPRAIVDLSGPGISQQFLYHNRPPADVILVRGCLMAICISILFGLTQASWTRRWFGAAAGRIELFVLDPNLTAHGRYAKNDVAAVWTIFLASASWVEYLTSRKRSWLWISGLALNAALASKFSALVLLPAYPLLAWYVWQRDREFRAVRSLLVVGLASFLVIFCAYNFELDGLRHSAFLTLSAIIFPLCWPTLNCPVPLSCGESRRLIIKNGTDKVWDICWEARMGRAGGILRSSWLCATIHPSHSHPCEQLP